MLVTLLEPGFIDGYLEHLPDLLSMNHSRFSVLLIQMDTGGGKSDPSMLIEYH